MDSTILVAMLVAGTGVGSPTILALLNGRQVRKGKEQDYARQDQVSERAEDVARAAQKSATEIVAANDRVAHAAAMANKKLDVIHGLVNSQMTSAIQSELDAQKLVLAMMREIIGLNSVAGRNPTEDTMGAVKATEAKIYQLQVTLSERRRQDEIAQAQTLEDKQ